MRVTLPAAVPVGRGIDHGPAWSFGVQSGHSVVVTSVFLKSSTK
jgi:hypothetical protein